LLAALAALEAEALRQPFAAETATIDQAGITCAVTWGFTQRMLAEIVDAAQYPALRAFSEGAEGLDAFAAAPFGATTMAMSASAPSAAAGVRSQASA
ncbi:MAG TPA: hypothetical protein VF308_09660, partial [Caldimonas sp.]